MQTHEGFKPMMLNTALKIRFEVSGQMRNSTKYAIEDKLTKIAPLLSDRVIESVKYFVCIHEPASYNDYKKTKDESLTVSLVIPEYSEYEGTFTRNHKTSVILADSHYFESLMKEFKMKWGGVRCHFDDNGRKSVSVILHKDTKA